MGIFLDIARMQAPQTKLIRIRDEIELEFPERLDFIGDQILRQIRYNLSGVVLNKRTGRLHASYKYELQEIIPKALWRLSTVSDVVYARIHDTGGWTGRNHASKIPKRPYHIKAWVEKQDLIRSQMRGFTAKLMR